MNRKNGFMVGAWNTELESSVVFGEYGGIISIGLRGNRFMLDAFIIEKIQKEHELRDGDRTPLRIEILKEPAHDATPAEEKDTERGIAIIDFTI